MKNLIEVIKTHRKAQKINQKEIAEKMNISESNYRDVESGKTRLSIDFFLKACEILNLDPLQILNENKNLIILTDDEINTLKKTENILKKITTQSDRGNSININQNYGKINFINSNNNNRN